MKGYYDIDKINASKLKLFSGDHFSPYTAVCLMRQKQERKRHFDLGHSVHEGLQYCGVIPEKYVRSEYETFRSKDAKEWRDEQESLGFIVLSQKEYDESYEMIQRVWSSCPPSIRKQIQESEEREIIVQNDDYKGMLDLRCPDIIWDYKTTAQTNEVAIERDAYKFGYHIQAHQYRWLGKREKFGFIFVSKTFPHEVFIMEPSEEFMDKGEEDWNIANERYLKYAHMPVDELPRKSDNIITLNLPSYVEEAKQTITIDGVEYEC